MRGYQAAHPSSGHSLSSTRYVGADYGGTAQHGLDLYAGEAVSSAGQYEDITHSQKIGQRLGLFEILDSESIETIIPDKGIEVAIVAVPANAAQEVVDALVRAGVKAILNYAPITVKVPKDLQVQYIDPVIHLQHMAYYL